MSKVDTFDRYVKKLKRVVTNLKFRCLGNCPLEALPLLIAIYRHRRVLVILPWKYQADILDQYLKEFGFEKYVVLRSRRNFPVILFDVAEKIQLFVSTFDILNLLLPDIETVRKKALKIGRGVDLPRVEQIFIELGYKRVYFVKEVGEFAVRGGIVDFFSPIYSKPIRIEMFGDTVESIRFFDPISQKSLSFTNEVDLFPSFESMEKSKSLKEIIPYEMVIFFNPNESNVVDLNERKKLLDFFSIENDRLLEIYQGHFPGCFNLKGEEGLLYKGREELLRMELERISADQGKEIFLCGAEDARKNFIEKLSKGDKIFKFRELDFLLPRGFFVKAIDFYLLSVYQLFPYVDLRKRKIATEDSGTDRSVPIPGTFVVHKDHGVGRFLGLRVIEDTEVLEIEYRDGQKLLLPVYRLNEIEPFGLIGVENVVLDKLGGSSWYRRKSRARRKVRKFALDIIKLEAERALSKAPYIFPDCDILRKFESEFRYFETEDQLRAVEDIKRDLESGKPMDRLVCGDVGFGKTEVAMRAAFKVVLSGYQVAVLAPTTVLVEQLFRVFSERFKEYPVVIKRISRFCSKKELEEVKGDLSKGKVDIVIGTHRLLNDDIKFYNLGLLIIDEEHRFGVEQKEKFKKLKSSIHILSMSATPIPRTLELALGKVKTFSLITSPPIGRVGVETIIDKIDSNVIYRAVSYEVSRGGQVFYVYNKVEDIEKIASWLRSFLDVRMTVIHGQMNEEILERRVLDFIDRKYDLLLTTTILESGIHIPTANTIIVHDAQKFGLAQLHQLRGRVGRSNVKGFCYLLVDYSSGTKGLDRVKIIELNSELGAGYKIAIKDLEMRGAGNLLGSEQAGVVSEIGINAYIDLLEKEIKQLRGEQVDEIVAPVIDCPFELNIPRDYIEETEARLENYKRLLNGENGIMEELQDRFGTPPEKVSDLFYYGRIRKLAIDLKVGRISFKNGKIEMVFRIDSPVRTNFLLSKGLDRENFCIKEQMLSVFCRKGEELISCYKVLQLLKESVDG